MKKIKVLATLVCVITLLCALALVTDAKWWDDNPFTDVKSSHWYYDAVRICNDNGIFNGTDEDTFAPSGKMTRAMLVQALASADGFDKADYAEGTPFTDVKTGNWFAPAVEWAYKNNITSGKTETTFAPNENITREQLAAMLYRYASYKGIEIANEKEIGSFPDADKVSSYAVKNLEWAYGNGIINGSKKGDELFLNPRNTATRAECAQMFSKYLYLEPVYEINGNDISLYKIVYDADAMDGDDSVLDAIVDLQNAIKGALGYELPIVTDETPVSDYEILVGKTNREDMGIVTFDRDFEDDQMFAWSVQGNYLVIAGIDDYTDYNTHEDKSHRNIEGTHNAVYYFNVKVLGVEEYCTDESYGIITEYKPDPVISLPDGLYYEDMVFFRTRIFYMEGGINGSGDYVDSLSTNMSTWISGDYSKEDDVVHDPTPCLTDENNIQAIITNVLKQLDRDPESTTIDLCINDSNGYCSCPSCAAMYKQYKSRSATMCLLANRVSDAITEKYPGTTIILGAYNYTQSPPEGLILRDNVTVEIITINNCNSHSYLDKTCPLNAGFCEDVDGWNEICTEIITWDHTGGFIYFMNPFPDWDEMLSNTRYFADSGSRAMLMNSVFYGEDLPNGESPETHAEFGPVRAYMLSKIYMDPYMSEEEFDYYLNNALRVYFGDGWQSLREYLDTHTKIADSSCSKHHAHPSGFHDYEEIRKVADHFNDLWADAKAKANTPEQLERIKICETTWIFMYQNATYETRYTNGTEEQRAEYEALNEYLFNMILEKRIHWTEGTLNLLDQYSPAKPPYAW